MKYVVTSTIQGGYKLSEDFVTPGHQTWQCVISSCGVSSWTMFTSHHFQRHYQNCDSASTPQSGTSHKTSLGGFGGKGSIAWTPAVSHVGRTSNAFNVTMKLQTFLFQMLVTSCISVQYLWKYGFAIPPIIYTHPVLPNKCSPATSTISSNISINKCPNWTCRTS